MRRNIKKWYGKNVSIPELPKGFNDFTWSNDVCPHFEKELNQDLIIDIWINTDELEFREAISQYMVGIRKADESEYEEYSEFNVNNCSSVGLLVASIKIKKLVKGLELKYQDY